MSASRKPRFRDVKATQAAAKFLKLRGGVMSHLKLVKLLYLLDREALLRWGRPVTYDKWVAMPHGPALSSTLNLINDEVEPGSAPDYWHAYISERENNEVRLLREPPTDQLSRAEEALIDEVFEKYGRKGRWELRDFTHTLPEYRDPHGSSKPISYADVLRAAGFGDNEIREIVEEIDAVALAERVLNS